MRGGLGSSSIIWETGTRYKFEILHNYGKRVKIKSQKDFGANFCVCRTYRGKADSTPFCSPSIPNRIKLPISLVVTMKHNFFNGILTSPWKLRYLWHVIPTVILLFENIIHDGWQYISVDTKHFNSQILIIPYVNRNITVFLVVLKTIAVYRSKYCLSLCLFSIICVTVTYPN